MIAAKYRAAKWRPGAAPFIRGSASWRDVAPLFNPRCSHEDDFLPHCRDRHRVPVPDRLGVCANRGAGGARACRQNGAADKKAEKPRTAASLECSKEADTKGIHGKERHKFMSECKKAAKDAAAKPKT